MKVKCIADKYHYDSSVPEEYKIIKKPIKDIIYTVRELVETEYGNGYLLEEIVNEEVYHDQGGWREPIFAIGRFEVVND